MLSVMEADIFNPRTYLYLQTVATVHIKYSELLSMCPKKNASEEIHLIAVNLVLFVMSVFREFTCPKSPLDIHA